MNTELENVKSENRDLKVDMLKLKRRLDLAHSDNRLLEVRCFDLDKQLRISEYWLKIEQNK